VARVQEDMRFFQDAYVAAVVGDENKGISMRVRHVCGLKVRFRLLAICYLTAVENGYHLRNEPETGAPYIKQGSQEGIRS
jgi:hypothetical protein